MSECYVHPAVDYPQYNAGEIRLYGRLAIGPLLDNILIPQQTFSDLIKFSKKGSRISPEERAGKIENIINEIEHAQKHAPKEIISIGLSAKGGRFGLAISDPNTLDAIQSIGIIYGYAFEGYCYKLPKPTIMLLPVNAAAVTDGDCGYDPALGYSVWATDKLARVVILDVRTDDLKTLVLDANTPGNRSPLAYSQNQALAPQRNRD